MPLLLTTRVLVVAVSVGLLVAHRRAWVARHHDLVSCTYMFMLAAAIGVMVFALGGFQSPYYAGINLCIVGGGVLFVWPLRHGLVQAAMTFIGVWLLPNALIATEADLPAAVSSSFFIFTTQVLVLVGQSFRYQGAQREAISRQQVELLGADLLRANDALSTSNDELAATSDRLRELDATKNRFFANLSHELRTPLTLILGTLRQLSDDPSVLTRRKAAVGLVNASRLMLLVNDVLDLAALDHDDVEVDKLPVDLAALARRTADAFTDPAQPDRLRVDIPPPNAWVLGDLRLLRTLLYNLLSNALKYADADRPRVHVALRIVGDKVHLSVADNGLGVPSGERDSIFDRFGRGRGQRAASPGTGIGLALVREIAHVHGGTVRVTDSDTLGARFDFAIDVLQRGSADAAEDDTSLQLAAYEDARVARAILAQTDPGETKAGPPVDAKPIVVLADDDDMMREYVTTLLVGEFDVREAEDGEVALSVCRAVEPVLLITDHMMPNMDGIDLLEAVRADATIADTPVLMLTARDGPSDRVLALERGADDFMTKPFGPRELLARARTLARTAAQSRELSRLNRMLSFANQQLAASARVDGLTGIANRRAFDERLADEWARHRRTKKPLAFIIADIDRFKAFNDTFGHQAGDDCLRRVARALTTSTKRSSDLVARYGGEEFALILPDTDAEGVSEVAVRIQEAVAAAAIEAPVGAPARLVTLSLGAVVTIPDPDVESAALVRAADRALYEAKRAGRDRFVVASGVAAMAPTANDTVH